MQDQADPHIVEQSQPNQPRGRRLLLIGGIVGALGFTLAVGMVRGGNREILRTWYADFGAQFAAVPRQTACRLHWLPSGSGGDLAMMMGRNDSGQQEQRFSVLVVDDEPNIVEFLRMGFEYEGFVVHVATDGPEALRSALAVHPDVIILDIMLPGMSGLDVAQRLRTASDAAVIMLTARDAVDDRVTGLDSGADDYVTKPFAFKELMARVRAVLRRKGKTLDRLLSFADLTLDRETRVVTRNGRAIELTPREFELLELFMMHPRQVLTRDVILSRIWGYDYVGDENVIEVFVRHLREKLDDIPPRLLQTVRGVGYALRG
jgi:two-component system response regulator MprA